MQISAVHHLDNRATLPDSASCDNPLLQSRKEYSTVQAVARAARISTASGQLGYVGIEWAFISYWGATKGGDYPVPDGR